MSETASKSYVDSEILKHENKWVEKTNKIKEDLSQIIQEDRHSSKNRDHIIMLDVHDNKENIALHNQWLEFMKTELSDIKTGMKEGIAEIKEIIKEQSKSFATKDEHNQNKEAHVENKQEIKNIKESNKKALIYIIGLLISIITSIVYIIISKNI